MKKMPGIAKQLLTTSLIFVLFSFSAYAEFYKYVDENGKTLYTDDLNNVPMDQRKSVEKYEESPLDPPMTPAAAPTERPIDETAGNASMAKMEAKWKTLLEKKSALDEEYQALMEDRKKLEVEKDAAKTNAAIKAHNENVARFNEKTKVFEEKRKVLEAEIEAYNTQLDSTSGTKGDTVETPSP